MVTDSVKIPQKQNANQSTKQPKTKTAKLEMKVYLFYLYHHMYFLDGDAYH